MRVIFAFFLIFVSSEAISYSVTSASNRQGIGRGGAEGFNPKISVNQRKQAKQRESLDVDVRPTRRTTRRQQVAVKVRPAPQVYSQRVAQSLPVQVTPARPSSSYNNGNPIEYGVKPYSHPPISAPMQVPVQVVPPVKEREQRVQTPPLGVKVYPPTMGNSSRGTSNEIQVDVGRSRPITQEMMFYPDVEPKRKLPLRQKQQQKLAPPPPQQPRYQEQYDDDDSEPLFVRNRNGVMLGFGIGGAFNRLWVGGSGDNYRFYDNEFTWYFRLGYQHYFTPYLGLRSYVHLGYWMHEIKDDFWDGKQGKRTEILANSNLNYSGYIEMLYDFVVLENHSFGIFGGFGVGVGSYEFSNDGTGTASDYFVMPMISAGFAYTLYLNNRFELEVKAPLRQGVLEGVYRSEFSTWMLGFSYTYVF